MKKLSVEQQLSIEKWIYANARPLEVAKWNVIFEKGPFNELDKEIMKYQNEDGGFGGGFESDILTPESAAISAGEAIFMAQDYNLDLTSKWAQKLYNHLEKTRQDTPSFWEPVPKSIEDHPHAPWWSYHEDQEFSPNPCAVIASALLLYGTDSQKALGNEIAVKCIEFIIKDTNNLDHDNYCLQRLFLSLGQIKSEFLNDKIITIMENRISSGVCYDESKWLDYVPQPFDLADSPDSPWYFAVKEGIEKNASYWIDSLLSEGYWRANFSWGLDNEISRRVTKNWLGYIAVKRVKILREFGFIE